MSIKKRMYGIKSKAVFFAILLAMAGCDRGGLPSADGGACAGSLCCDKPSDAILPCGVDQIDLENDGGKFRVNFCKADAGCDNQQICSQTIVDMIRSAERSIHVLIYDFCIDEIANALVSAARCGRIDGGAGIDIRVVIDKNHQECPDVVDKLRAAQIPVYFLGTGAKEMHDKIIIIDGIKFATGSFNWTGESNRDNDENLLVSYSADAAASYEIAFKDVWNKAIDGGPYAGETADDGGYKGQDISSSITTSFCPEKLCKYDAGLINCPNPHCINKVLALIRSAQESVHIAANWMTLAAIRDELLLIKDHISVKIIFSRLSSCGNGSDFDELRTKIGCDNVRVDKKRQYGEMHHKFIIIDGQNDHLAKVAAGSMNYAESPKDNDENIIIVQSAALAAKYEAEFSRMFDHADKICYCLAGEGLMCDGGCD